LLLGSEPIYFEEYMITSRILEKNLSLTSKFSSKLEEVNIEKENKGGEPEVKIKKF